MDIGLLVVMVVIALLAVSMLLTDRKMLAIKPIPIQNTKRRRR